MIRKGMAIVTAALLLTGPAAFTAVAEETETPIQERQQLRIDQGMGTGDMLKEQTRDRARLQDGSKTQEQEPSGNMNKTKTQTRKGERTRDRAHKDTQTRSGR